MNMEPMHRARERRGAPAREYGLAVLSAMTAAEIFDQARPDQAMKFYAAVGARLAALVDVADVRDLDELGARISAFWAACGCGAARFTASATGITVVHHDAPLGIEGDQQKCWARAFPALLQGAYDAWFRQLGSGPALSTRIIASAGTTIEFRHGI